MQKKIDDKILKKLPIEFQKMKPSLIEKQASQIKSISVKLYNTDKLFSTNFYRPISKIISYFEEI